MTNKRDLSSNEVYSVIYDKTGVQVDTTFLTDCVDEWRDWYNGYVNGFHSYTETVMGTVKSFNRLSLKAGAKAANSWAELLTREFPDIAINDQVLAERVEEILKKENFKEELVKYLELGFAEGTTALVEYIVGDEVHIDFLSIDDIVPLSWKNGVVSELATINLFTKESYYVTHIQLNRYINGDYIIENIVYMSDDENDLGKEVEPEVIGLDAQVTFAGVKPFFQVIRPNIINKYDIDSPYGQSIFADGLSTLEAIDKKYTEFDNEFCTGRRRIIVSSDALKKEIDTSTGQWVSYLGSDNVYQAVARSGNEPLFEVFDVQLREQSFINALNQEFNFLADSVGMDAGTFVFNGVSMKTATEVISEKSKTFGNKKKHDKMLKTVIEDCVKAIIHCLSAIDNRQYDDEVTVTMNDQVLIDQTAKKADERIDTQAGYMPKSTYLMRNYGISEEEANQWLLKAKEEQGTVNMDALENMFRPTEGGE